MAAATTLSLVISVGVPWTAKASRLLFGYFHILAYSRALRKSGVQFSKRHCLLWFDCIPVMKTSRMASVQFRPLVVDRKLRYLTSDQRWSNGLNVSPKSSEVRIPDPPVISLVDGNSPSPRVVATPDLTKPCVVLRYSKFQCECFRFPSMLWALVALGVASSSTLMLHVL